MTTRGRLPGRRGLRTRYARPIRDHWRFLRSLVTPRTTVIPHAFWRSSMEIVAQKPA
jgi:hypothetical protein